MCLMGAHQQKFLHQHELQQNANIMYENLFPTTKINFADFDGGVPAHQRKIVTEKKSPGIALPPIQASWSTFLPKKLI